MMQRIACLLALWCVVGALAHMRVDTSTNGFVDPQGRHRIFHGLNMVYKVPPYYPRSDDFDPQLSVAAEDIKNIQEWGFTMARVGMMWPGGEPTRGVYNETYFDEIEDLVNRLGEAGIYSLLDVHQDLFSRFYCGEGAPDWAVQTERDVHPFPWPLPYNLSPDNSTGYPSLVDCLKVPFFEYYVAEEVGASFQALYNNFDGIENTFINYWRHAAKRFKDNPFVLGYELLNEPLGGDFYHDPSLLLVPGKADRVNLQPMYSALHHSIREIDDEHIIFFEPAVSDVFKSGFEEGPGGPAYNDRQAYSYHIYCLMVNRTGDPRFINLCEDTEGFFWKNRVDDYKRIGCGGFMTEFGDNSNSSTGIENLNWMTAKADEHLQSWSYWAFKEFHDITTQGFESLYNIKGELEVGKLKALSRTHPQATAGVPLFLSFDPDTANMTYQYSVDTTISAPTVVFASESMYYPNGWQVSCVPDICVTSNPSPNIISITHSSSAKNGDPVTVTVLPADEQDALPQRRNGGL